MAHELRQPIGTLKNCAHLLRRRGLDDDERMAEILALLDSEADRAATIIGSLLDYANPSAPRRQRVDVRAAVATVVSAQPLSDGIAVETTSAPDVWALFDPEHLSHVLRNLVRNADQAMGGHGRLALRTAVDGDRVVIAVTDTGPGVSAADLDRIFESLFTTRSQGIGMGLALAKLLVESNEGTLTVRSLPHSETTFTVTATRAP